MTRALVMGGGGVVGVAWETGLVSGLAEAGVDLREADLIVGTSAGSMVGSLLAGGRDLRQPPPERSELRILPLPESGPDLARLTQIFKTWSTVETMTEEALREIGSLALAANTAPEQDWIAATGQALEMDDWPETPLRICAVDVATGEFRVHSRESGAPLHAAVASSCAIPGMFPPVRIDGARYMDGGVRSGTSADVALDFEPDAVLVVAPICERSIVIGALAERCLALEVERLESIGAKVCVVFPEEVEVEAFGGSLMDPTRIDAARDAGHTRGLQLAASGRIHW